MRKSLGIGVIVLVAAAGGGVAIARYAHKTKSPHTESAPPPAAAENKEATLVGRVQPRTSSLVPAPMEGTLEAFFVEVGQGVYKDQLLGKIRSADLDAAEQQAQLTLDKAQTRATALSGDQLASRLEASRATVDQSRARADLDRLEKTYQRQKGLWELGATARLAFEKAEKDYNDARAAIDKADAAAKQAADRAAAIEAEIDQVSRAAADASAAVDRANAALTTAEIHSPVDGIVLARRGQPGEPVDPSIKDLLQIGTELTALQVIATPDPAALARIHPGEAASIRVPELNPDELPGTVREIRGADVIVDFTSPVALTKLDLAAQVRIKF